MSPTTPVRHENLPITPIPAHEMQKHPALSSRSLSRSRLQVRDYRNEQSIQLSQEFGSTFLSQPAFLRDSAESRASLLADASRETLIEAMEMAQAFQAPPFNGKEVLAAASKQNIMGVRDSMIPKRLPYQAQAAGTVDSFWQLQIHELPAALEVPLVKSLQMKVHCPTSIASLHMRCSQMA